MKTIAVEHAVGTVLCHDITRIVPGAEKGPAFRRGHVVRQEDIPVLLDIGKANLYVYDPADGYVHEDAAAVRLSRAAAGQGIAFGEPQEGKVTLTAEQDGLLCIDVNGLMELNLMVMAEGVCAAHRPIIEVKPLRSAKVGVVTTGSEIFHGRIKDGFGPLLRAKFEDLGSEVIDQVFVSDIVGLTVDAITSLVRQGADFIAVTGGMSVDPDDQTPAAIRATGAEVVTYGAPTYPGAMFMLAYLDDVPIVGLPGCVMYYKASIFELVVPRILAGERLTRRDIVALGHGGLCENCRTCHYPACGFGK